MKTRYVWPLYFLLFTVACGPGTQAPDVDGATQRLIAAIDAKNSADVKSALSAGARADAQAGFANTALHFACESADVDLANDVLSALESQKKSPVELAAALSQVNKDEKTAVEVAALASHMDIIDAVGAFCEKKQIVRTVLFPVTKKLASTSSENVSQLIKVISASKLGAQLIYETIGTKEGQNIIQAFEESALLSNFAKAYVIALSSSEDIQGTFLKVAAGFRVGKRTELVELMKQEAAKELYRNFEQSITGVASQLGVTQSVATSKTKKEKTETTTTTAQEKETNVDYNAILREAVAEGKVEIVLKVLERGARLDALDPNLQNVFHVAVQRGQAEALTTLLAQLRCANAGTMLLQKDSNGQTPFNIAAKNFTKEKPRTLHILSEFLLSGESCQKIAIEEIRDWVKSSQETPVKNAFFVFSEAYHGIEVLADISYRLLSGNFSQKTIEWIEDTLSQDAKDQVWARVYFRALKDGDEARRDASRSVIQKYADAERRQIVGFMLFQGSGQSDKKARERVLGELEHLQLPKEIFEASNDGIAEMKAALDEIVTSQDRAKVSLAVAIKNHYERVQKGLKKSNILILGPSGTGKTLLVQTIAKKLDVPFTIFDATNITQAGYVGGKAEDAVASLAQKALFDKKMTERGIIFLDEIDKMAGRSGKSELDEFKRQGQASLLKLLEGIEVEVKINKMQSMLVDTKNILFVCAGAFTGLIDIVDARLKLEGRTLSENPFEQATAEDIIKYGMQHELVGRLPNFITLRALSASDLTHILNNPKASVLEEYRESFSGRGVELKFTPESIAAIAERALTYKTGARALRTVVEAVMADLQFRISQMGSLKSITITERVVRYGDMPNLEYKNPEPPAEKPLVDQPPVDRPPEDKPKS